MAKKYEPKKILIELEEYNELTMELELLKQPATGKELTGYELQEATGILLIRAVQNPMLFRQVPGVPIDLGKYKAIFVFKGAETTGADPQLLIKFERKD